MAPCVRELKSKTVDGDRISLRSYPSPSRGRYYAVKKNGRVVAETRDRDQARRDYSKTGSKSKRESTTGGFMEDFGIL